MGHLPGNRKVPARFDAQLGLSATIVFLFFSHALIHIIDNLSRFNSWEAEAMKVKFLAQPARLMPSSL